MAGPKDLVPSFEKGMVLKAADLEALAQRVRALMPLQPGGFVSAGFTVQRPLALPVDEGGAINFFRCVLTLCALGTGWGLDEITTCNIKRISDDGTLGDDEAAKINGFDNVPVNTPGWGYDDGTTIWFLSPGCNAGPEVIDEEE